MFIALAAISLSLHLSVFCAASPAAVNVPLPHQPSAPSLETRGDTILNVTDGYLNFTAFTQSVYGILAKYESIANDTQQDISAGPSAQSSDEGTVDSAKARRANNAVPAPPPPPGVNVALSNLEMLMGSFRLGGWPATPWTLVGLGGHSHLLPVMVDTSISVFAVPGMFCTQSSGCSGNKYMNTGRNMVSAYSLRKLPLIFNASCLLHAVEHAALFV